MSECGISSLSCERINLARNISGGGSKFCGRAEDAHLFSHTHFPGGKLAALALE